LPSELDDPLFRLQIRTQLQAMREEPQWVIWYWMRGEPFKERAYGWSLRHRLITPVDRHIAPGTVQELSTPCGRNVTGPYRHIGSPPDGPQALCRTCMRLQPQRPGLS
jgi:hypothetical protein